MHESRLSQDKRTAGNVPEPDMHMPRQFDLHGGTRAWGSISTPIADTEFRFDPDYSSQLRQLRLRLLKAASFLDVGCGTGAIMAYAKEINPRLRVVGIDVRPEVVGMAERHGEVICQDAFSYGHYATFDLIYMFRPLVEFRNQMMLEDCVIQRMRRGATLLSLMPAHHLLLAPGCRGVYTKRIP